MVDEAIIKDHQLVINCTPVGMYPNVNEYPQLPYKFLSDQHYLYDLIYKPEKTLFLKRGEERGARIQNGLDMLTIQAEESWKIWNTD
jgi:shikimate dehydrogenase